jgi:hypothetical protein
LASSARRSSVNPRGIRRAAASGGLKHAGQIAVDVLQRDRRFPAANELEPPAGRHLEPLDGIGVDAIERRERQRQIRWRARGTLEARSFRG